MNCDHFIAYVNSKNRLTGSDSSFTYQIDLPTGSKFDSMCILQATIPKSYYLIDTGRNTFTLTEGLTSISITIPNGNYTRKSFGITLVGLLNIASPNGYHYSVSVPNANTQADTGKYLFGVLTAIGGAVTTQPMFTMPTSSSPGNQMGFVSGTSVQFVAGQLLSTNVINMQAIQTVNILSDAVSNNGTNILQNISASSPDFSILSFQVGNYGGIVANHKDLLHNLSNRFSFTLVNGDGEILNLNGLHWQCSILFWDADEYQHVKAKRQSEQNESIN